MDPLILMGGAAAALIALKHFGKKDGAAPVEVVSTGFEPFPPDQQAHAWWAATGRQWQATGPMGDSAGRIAQTFRGASVGNPDMNRPVSDSMLRANMNAGLRAVVSVDVFGGQYPYLAFVPDGFRRSDLPSSWGEMRQLFAPAPGSYGAPGQFPPGGGGGGGGVTPPPGGDASVFNEIQDPATRAQVKELYASSDAGLLELDQVAAELDKAGYAASATAIRERRKQVALARSLAAKQRGGWLYVVRMNDLPFKVAQHYGGVRPKALQEMAAANPDIAQGGTWKGWIAGEEILLPGSWPDPSLKPLPPLASGGAKPTTSHTSPGGGGSGALADRVRQLQDPNDPRNAAERLKEIMAGKADRHEPISAWRTRKLVELMGSAPTPTPPITDPWGEATQIDAGITPATFERS